MILITGFRDFEVGFTRPLKFEEEETVYVSFFEPMLFDGILKKSGDYYEINFNQPMEEMEFFMTFPSGAQVLSFDLSYLGNGGGQVDKKIMREKKITRSEDEKYTIYFRLKRPPVGRTIILSYNLCIAASGRLEESDEKDKFRAGLFVHTKLKESDADRWTAEEKPDGSILLRPVR
jgi:hypothetical protein